MAASRARLSTAFSPVPGTGVRGVWTQSCGRPANCWRKTPGALRAGASSLGCGPGYPAGPGAGVGWGGTGPGSTALSSAHMSSGRGSLKWFHVAPCRTVLGGGALLSWLQRHS